MAVRMFKVGDLCVHKGYICRVDAVQRRFAKGLSYMGVKDGVEFNPVLTITPITGPNGENVKKASARSVVSGGVDTMEEAKKKIGKDIKSLQQKLLRMEKT